jgi:rod shape-determining protein MreD
MSYYVGISLLFLLAVLEASILPMFRIAGLQPNLVLVFLITWLMVRGAEEAFVLIPIGGIVLGLVDGALLGTALLALAPIAILQDLRGSQLREGGLIMAIVFTAIMTLAYNYTFLAVYAVQGQSGDWLSASINVIVPTAFLNVALLLPLYVLFSVLSPEQRRSVYA